MDHWFMFEELFPVLINIIIVILAALVPTTQSAHPQFEACKPQSCGKGLSISYPFYIPHVQESYCGYPEYEISCKDEEPFIQMSDQDYLIKNIFYTNRSLLVANAKALQTDCLAPLHNFTLNGTPFEFSPAHIDLFFFYNCISFPNFGFPLNCVSNDTSNHSFVMFTHYWEMGYLNNYSVACKSSVSAPVDMDGGKSFGTQGEKGYLEYLKTGFILEWSESNCSECEGSGGRCGFYENEFVCFCPDGRRPQSCIGDGSKFNWTIKLIIGFSSLAGGTLICLLFFVFYRRRHNGRLFGIAKSKNLSPSSTPLSGNMPSNPTSEKDIEKGSTYFGVHIFTYDELEEATNNFDSSKELGDGGFGTVYYGKLRDGRVVAVKRLYENNYKRVEQFMNEVKILTRLRHQNLVTLYGCTSRHSRELLLVYEFVPNGTVADHLHGDRAGSLTWPTRMSIAIETASALSYLHASDIIHRDVKTNNILLDNNFRVKVADFGLSRLFPTDVSHVSTAPQGTPGYVDPDYHQCYQLTDKSDVYSFGVVLIELISSKPAVDITRHRHEINLANLAINKIQNHALHELIDPCLGFKSDNAVKKMTTLVAELAFRCLQLEKEMRPSMDEVLTVLREIESEEYKVKAEEVEISADDVGLLKNTPPPLSPDSVTDWVSQSTTPSASS